MASTAVLSTLQHVTEVKLGKLARQQAVFEERKNSILDAVSKESKPAEKVRYLLENVKSLRVGRPSSGTYENMSTFLSQAEHDTSISHATLNEWQEKLERPLHCQHEKYRFTSLFGRMVTEWIKNPNDVQRAHHPASDDGSESDATESSFEAIGRKEMHEQRKEWESYAFKERPTDSSGITEYLDNLFKPAFKSKASKKTPLENIREHIGSFDENGLERFDNAKIRLAIDGLLKADLFAGAKRKALVDLKAQDAVLTEMADVLNADLDALEDWEWNPTVVPVSMRKQINGKYRVFMDEELYQAIFLQFIGTLWAVHLKSAFVSFFHSGAWTQAPYRALTRKDMRRREHFLGPRANANIESVRNERRETYLEKYFVTILPDSISSGSPQYGSESDTSENGDHVMSPFQIKQSLLSLVTTESLIHTHIYGKFTVLQSDFKWFGPSLPHSTIFTVLAYFGVPEKWGIFFQKFLQVPLSFEQDGADSEPQTRRCGIPMSHVLADAIGECVLFVLDFAVNQRTKGANLYRFHDDLWFWGQPDSCIAAWKAMTEFSRIMGLELNEEKTGSCQVTSDTVVQALPKGLPKGDIRWGFLKMTPGSGRWTVDEAQIMEHTQELKRQLSACRSVFAYIEAYNAYMGRFFLNNLGPRTNCFGRDHVRMAIEAIKKIQQELFRDGESSTPNVAEHLRTMIADLFGVDDVPDGFIFFPPELGGLGVRSPLIPLVRSLEESREPADLIESTYELEEEEYEEAKRKYEAGEIKPTSSYGDKFSEDEPFMSLEEYMAFREERSTRLLDDAYTPLQAESKESTVNWTSEMALASGTAGDDLHFPHKTWVLELYGREVVKRFGGLRMGERELLPIGLLDMLKSEKVRWQG